MMQKVIESSRLQFTRKRADIEAEISKWYEPIEPPPKPAKEGGFGEGKPVGASAPYNPKPAAAGASFGKSIDARQPSRGASAPYNPRPAAPAAAVLPVPARVPVAAVPAAPEKKLAFKEAFAAVNILPASQPPVPSPAASLPKPASQDSNRPNQGFPTMPLPAKPAPSKNLAGLREALAAIKKSEAPRPAAIVAAPIAPAQQIPAPAPKPEQAAEKKPHVLIPPKHVSIAADALPQPAAPRKENPREIPEEELKKMLDVPPPPEVM